MPGSLRKLFTNDDILTVLEAFDNDLGEAAAALSDLGRGTISRQLLRYWKQHLDFKKTNGEPYVGTTVLDRQIKNDLELRRPSPADWLRAMYERTEPDNSRILFIPDQHSPYHHPDTIPFLIAVAAKYQPTRVINLGDETDGHALSMHDSDPSLDSAGVELNKAREFIAQLARVFPVMDVCHSNHGSLIYRRAFKSGIPVEYIKSYKEILFPDGGGEGWEWHDGITLTLPNGEKVRVQHQVSGGMMAFAAHERCSVVLGHLHGQYEIEYRASSNALYFGMISGCLIDREALAFAYGKLFSKKPIVGCSVIIDSQPMLVPMLLNEDGRWTGSL